jgi:hypothetical protein
MSVFATRGLWADALTKVVALAPELGAHLVRRMHATAVVLRDDGTGAVCGGRAATSSRWWVGGGGAA